jgi:uncharacterized protein with von Willebrand factor type A (vWA) domain
VEKLAATLGELQHLNSLTINLAGCGKINDESILSLANLLTTNLPKLNFLEIDLSGCPEITIHAVQVLNAAIEEHRHKFEQLPLGFIIKCNLLQV